MTGEPLVFGERWIVCPRCNGSGETRQSFDGLSEWGECPKCHGSGAVKPAVVRPPAKDAPLLGIYGARSAAGEGEAR
jgi:hypothetical protein